MRRVSCALVLGAALLGQAAVAQADLPAGPRLAFVRTSYPRGHRAIPARDLLTGGPAGEAQQLVTRTAVPGGVEPTTGIAWSPDGKAIAIGTARAVGGSALVPSDELDDDLLLVGADGSGLRQVTNLGLAIDPVFSADGATLYFSRFGTIKSVRTLHSSMWAIGTDGTGLRQLTQDRPLVFDEPSSVSPAGDELAFTRIKCDLHHRCGFTAMGFAPSTGAVRLLARHAFGPVYSPDGSRIALSSVRDHNGEIRTGQDESQPASELYVQDTATGRMRRLTRSKDIEEGSPSWDPSGQRIAFMREDSSFASWVLETNSDGSCTTRVLGTPTRRRHALRSSYSFPAWQPGPGRGAGPIAC